MIANCYFISGTTMDYIELLAKSSLWINNLELYVPTFLLGFYCVNRKVFSQALVLLFFTMIYNLYLKSIWQIPLTPPLEGWAFPSGHMHAGWVFWGWLALQFNLRFTLPIFLGMMLLSGWAMSYHNYHNLADMLGAAGFGSVSLLLYTLINKKLPVLKDNFFLVAVILGGMGITLIQILPEAMQTKPHIWLAQGGIMGVAIGWLIFEKNQASLKFEKQQLIYLPMILAGLLAINLMLSHSHPMITQQNMSFLKMFLSTLWILCSLPLFGYLQHLLKSKFLKKIK